MNPAKAAPKRGFYLVVVGLWLAVLLLGWLYLRSQDRSALTLIQEGLVSLSSSPWGPFVLFGAFLLRPLFLFPITLLTVFSGYLFGPTLGFGYAMLATLLSCTVAYSLGGIFGRGALSQLGEAGFIKRLRERSFETVLLSRLLFLPGDLINYAAGFFRIPLLSFLGASALGGASGLLVSVLAGASIEGQFDMRSVQIDYRYVLGSSLILLLSLGLAALLRRRTDLDVKEISQKK